MEISDQMKKIIAAIIFFLALLVIIVVIMLNLNDNNVSDSGSAQPEVGSAADLAELFHK